MKIYFHKFLLLTSHYSNAGFTSSVMYEIQTSYLYVTTTVTINTIMVAIVDVTNDIHHFSGASTGVKAGTTSKEKME